MKQQFFCIILLCLTCSLNSTHANNVLLVPSKYNIQTAIQDAGQNDTVRLDNDVTVPTSTYIAKTGASSIVLDLNECIISGTVTNCLIIVEAGTLTILDSSTNKNGKIINNTPTTAGIAIGTSNTGSIILHSGIMMGSKGISHLGKNLEIKGGTITSTYNESAASVYAIAASKTTVSISDGIIEGQNNTIRLINNATCNITGGQFSCGTNSSIINAETGTTTYISGGIFSSAVTPASGYFCNDNTDAGTTASYPFCVNNEKLTYYAGTATAVSSNIQATAWQTVQTTNPNAMAVVSSQYAEWAKSQTNVLVENTGVDGSATYSCSKFVLTDLKDFYAPSDFTADIASYSRATTLQYNSLCLPFALKPQDVDGIIYNFSSFDSNNSTITMDEQNDGITASVPCIFKANTPGTALTIRKENVSVSSSVNNAGNIKGRFILDTNFGGSGIYKLNSTGTSFGYTTDAAQCFPFRSYLDLRSFDEAKASSLNILWGKENPTDIKYIKNNVPLAYPTEHYSIDGIKYSSHSNGLNIIKCNNGQTIKILTK